MEYGEDNKNNNNDVDDDGVTGGGGRFANIDVGEDVDNNDRPLSGFDGSVLDIDVDDDGNDDNGNVDNVDKCAIEFDRPGGVIDVSERDREVIEAAKTIAAALCREELEKEYTALKTKENEDQIELRRLRTENRLLRQRIENLEKSEARLLRQQEESSTLADRLVQDQVTRAQEAEEVYALRNELSVTKQQLSDTQKKLLDSQDIIGDIKKRTRIIEDAVYLDQGEEQNMVKHLQEELIAVRLRETETADIIKGLKVKITDLEDTNQRLQRAPSNDVQQLQEELIAVKLREAEANLSLKELKMKVFEIEKYWEAHMERVRQASPKDKGTKAEIRQLQEEVMTMKTREAKALLEAKEVRKKLMEMETQNHIVTNQIRRMGEDNKDAKKQLEEAEEREKDLKTNLKDLTRKLDDTESKRKEEGMMSRILEAESIQQLAELQRKIAELDIQKEEVLAALKLLDKADSQDLENKVYDLQDEVLKLKLAAAKSSFQSGRSSIMTDSYLGDNSDEEVDAEISDSKNLDKTLTDIIEGRSPLLTPRHDKLQSSSNTIDRENNCSSSKLSSQSLFEKCTTDDDDNSHGNKNVNNSTPSSSLHPQESSSSSFSSLSSNNTPSSHGANGQQQSNHQTSSSLSSNLPSTATQILSTTNSETVINDCDSSTCHNEQIGSMDNGDNTNGKKMVELCNEPYHNTENIRGIDKVDKVIYGDHMESECTGNLAIKVDKDLKSSSGDIIGNVSWNWDEKAVDLSEHDDDNVKKCNNESKEEMVVAGKVVGNIASKEKESLRLKEQMKEKLLDAWEMYVEESVVEAQGVCNDDRLQKFGSGSSQSTYLSSCGRSGSNISIEKCKDERRIVCTKKGKGGTSFEVIPKDINCGKKGNGSRTIGEMLMPMTHTGYTPKSGKVVVLKEMKMVGKDLKPGRKLDKSDINDSEMTSGSEIWCVNDDVGNNGEKLSLADSEVYDVSGSDWKQYEDDIPDVEVIYESSSSGSRLSGCFQPCDEDAAGYDVCDALLKESSV